MIMSLYKKISKISDMVPEKTAIIFEEKEIVYSQLHKDYFCVLVYFWQYHSPYIQHQQNQYFLSS